MRVINRMQSPIALPFGIGLIERGQSRDISKAQKAALWESATCDRWLRNGQIAIDEGESVDLDANPTPVNLDAETEEQEAERLLNELADLGIKRDKRTSLKKLRELAEEARA